MVLTILGIATAVGVLISFVKSKMPTLEVHAERVKLAVVDDQAYWMFQNKWYTAPMIYTPDSDQIEEIDIDTAPIEQVHLLMEIVGRFDESSDSWDEDIQ